MGATYRLNSEPVDRRIEQPGLQREYQRFSTHSSSFCCTLLQQSIFVLSQLCTAPRTCMPTSIFSKVYCLLEHIRANNHYHKVSYNINFIFYLKISTVVSFDSFESLFFMISLLIVLNTFYLIIYIDLVIFICLLAI